MPPPLEIVPLKKPRWEIRFQGDNVPLGEYDSLAKTETEARAFASEYGIDTIVVHERDGEQRVITIEPEFRAPTARDVKGPAVGTRVRR